MEFIELGKTGFKVSRICMGGCPMGRHGWGEVSKGELIRAVRAAVDDGVNFFDTADIYGLGEGERTLGEALSGGTRLRVFIASKFGVRRNGKGVTYYDNSPAWIEEALSKSLERLGTDYLDLYQVHYRDHAIPLGKVVEKLEELKKKGKIRAFGLSNILMEDFAELEEYRSAFSSFQDEYSLANRSHENDIESLRSRLGLTPMTWGSLGQGILSGKYDRDSVFPVNDRRSRETYVNFHGERLEKNMKIVDVIRKIADDTGRTPTGIALRWILDTVAESVVLVGMKNESQLESNLGSVGWKLSDEQWAALDAVSKA
jgi:myo-inositol catabolism protein IolS